MGRLKAVSTSIAIKGSEILLPLIYTKIFLRLTAQQSLSAALLRLVMSLTLPIGFLDGREGEVTVPSASSFPVKGQSLRLAF